MPNLLRAILQMLQPDWKNDMNEALEHLDPGQEVRRAVEDVYRAESRRVFATLVRLLQDLELAEEALHDAFQAALERWPVIGIPKNPCAWLISTGRFKGIDALRRRARFDHLEDVETLAEGAPSSVDLMDDTGLEGPTSGPSPSRARNRSAGSFSGGSMHCRSEMIGEDFFALSIWGARDRLMGVDNTSRP